MTDPLRVNTDDLRRAGSDLQDLSSKLKEVLSTLTDKLAAEGSPWGDDKIGDKFANGDSGYLAQDHWLSSSIDGKAQLLDLYGGICTSSANGFDKHDQ